jgi:hypothetical protein
LGIYSLIYVIGLANLIALLAKLVAFEAVFETNLPKLLSAILLPILLKKPPPPPPEGAAGAFVNLPVAGSLYLPVLGSNL